MGHIFISYSHNDINYVEKLEKKLIDEGFDVWVDHRINYGSRWTREIENAIDTCDAYIIVMSETAKESQWVQREMIHAENRKKPFFPLLLSGNVWFSLVDIQYFDVRGGQLPSGKFFARLAGGEILEEEIDTRKDLDDLFSRARRFELLGDFERALNLYYEVRRLDKYYPRIEVVIEKLEKELAVRSATLSYDGYQPSYASDRQEKSGLSWFWIIVCVLAFLVAIFFIVIYLMKIETRSSLGDSWTRPADGMVMSYIPAGEFEMGSEDGSDDEKPVHSVYLDGFWMDQTEVTNAMYLACVETGRCDSLANKEYLNDPFYAQYPVSRISWDDASNYCEKVGGRLPTEAEWEKAARGTLQGKSYPWGNENPVCDLGADNGAKFDDNANCDNTGPEQVASFSPNDYGLYDMAGNVWEWTADWYSENYYSSSPLQNPLGPLSGEFRVLRGGSWYTDEVSLSTVYRFEKVPNYDANDFGFRCARSVSE